MRSARIEAVCVVHELRPGFFHDTAIDKRPVEGPVEVTSAGLVGDRQMDRTHGGPDKAIYAYPSEDADWWATELGIPVPSGMFGENLRVRGLDVSGAVIGERWQIGDVVLEVRMPRTPCQNLSLRVGIEGFHVRFNASGRVGALLKVLNPGMVAAGDRIVVRERPDHPVTISALAGSPDPFQMRALLDSRVSLAPKVRSRAQRVVDRA